MCIDFFPKVDEFRGMKIDVRNKNVVISLIVKKIINVNDSLLLSLIKCDT